MFQRRHDILYLVHREKRWSVASERRVLGGFLRASTTPNPSLKVKWRTSMFPSDELVNGLLPKGVGRSHRDEALDLIEEDWNNS